MKVFADESGKQNKKNVLLEVSGCVIFTCAHFSLPSQAKPKEVQATRDFAESRKLALVSNDFVTLVEHGWVRKRRVGVKQL